MLDSVLYLGSKFFVDSAIILFKKSINSVKLKSILFIFQACSQNFEAGSQYFQAGRQYFQAGRPKLYWNRKSIKFCKFLLVINQTKIFSQNL